MKRLLLVLLLFVFSATGACGRDAHEEPTELLARLRALPGVTVEEHGAHEATGYYRIALAVEQPIDHQNPAAGFFRQRIVLMHMDDYAPMVFEPLGYEVYEHLSELAYVFGANQLAVEHRYYGESAPAERNWNYLTIRQAAADHHHVVELVKPLYPGGWLATGMSKGGVTALFHRRFYPQDITTTVPYVAPINTSMKDPRFAPFLAMTAGTPECRARLLAFQRASLARRNALAQTFGRETDVLHPLYRDYVDSLPPAQREQTLQAWIEERAQSFPFSFWMRMGAADCTDIPPADADDAHMFRALRRWLPRSWSDKDLALQHMIPFNIQTAKELGYPDAMRTELADLLEFDRRPNRNDDDFQPPEMHTRQFGFDPSPSADVLAWAARDARSVFLVYGEWDPWTAGSIPVANDPSNLRIDIPRGNHSAAIADLPLAQARVIYERIALSAGMSLAQVPPQWLARKHESYRAYLERNRSSLRDEARDRLQGRSRE